MRLIDADALIDAIKNSIDEDREIYLDDNISKSIRVGMRSVINIIKVIEPQHCGRVQLNFRRIQIMNSTFSSHRIIHIHSFFTAIQFHFPMSIGR